MTHSAMELIPVDGAQLEVEVRGTGEPVVLVQTALVADELGPLAAQLAPADYRTVLYHRRGYAGSSPVVGPRSIVLDAADCRALLSALGIKRAHIVGLSFSAAIALQLAHDAPEFVHSLTLLEPAPVHVPSAAEFRSANAQLQDARHSLGPATALEEFLTLVVGPDWRADIEQRLPGSTEQVQRDASTFFDSDMPALLAWQFTEADAAGITCPVLHIGGTDSGPWFAEVRNLVRSWFPQAEDVLITGAGHSLAITHATDVAAALLPFLKRHPMDAGKGSR